MRWQNLALDADAPPPGLPAPLFAQGAVVRRFDTPHFRGITFYEVRARSIINKVPEASRVPVRWTINPYRGCSHACAYCLSGDTQVLMSDGRSKALADLRVGDEVIGTVRKGSYRRYVPTKVLAHWRTIKPAYRVTLEDGTVLVASGDHRFLTDRGWKHVTGAMSGPDQRPYLTTNDSLLGIGQYASTPEETDDYRRGYLTGMLQGDAHIGSYTYVRADRTRHVHRFRLALTDQQVLIRAHAYLARIELPTRKFVFASATPTRRAMNAIRTSKKAAVQQIRDTIAWPAECSREWQRGFLGGVFDAEGSYSRGILRISNTDPTMLAQIMSSLLEFGIAFSLDIPLDPIKAVNVRIVGGLPEHVRFFHLVDPAITRKRAFGGYAVKSQARLRVVAIEPLGLEMPMYDITTGTGDFLANGVISHNCFARKTHTYLDLDAGHDFDTSIVVKVNAEELLRKELSRRSWTGEHIAMGTNVDCYQRAEGRYQLMRGILSALGDAANPFSILTKGALILRDLDLLQRAAERADVGTNVSVGFIDRDMWRSVESGTPSPQRRLEVCHELNAGGIPCGVLMAPILPYLTDSPAQLEATVKAIAESGATHISPIALHLRPGAREWYFSWLAENHPILVPKYDELYRRGAYAPREYQNRITEQVRDLTKKHRVGATTPARTRQIQKTPRIPPYQQLTLL
jgi:DNA repair photolyase